MRRDTENTDMKEIDEENYNESISIIDEKRPQAFFNNKHMQDKNYQEGSRFSESGMMSLPNNYTPLSMVDG